MNKHWQSIVFRHCYQKYQSQATWEIFQLTLNSEQSASMSCIHFGKAETAQQSCHHRSSLHDCSTLVPVVYSPNISPCYGAYFTEVSKFPEILGELSMRKQCVPVSFFSPPKQPVNLCFTGYTYSIQGHVAEI